MLSIIKKIIARKNPLLFITGLNRVRTIKRFVEWKKRNFLAPPPQIVKQSVLEKYAVVGGVWVETGTFYGLTTEFLARRFPHVHTIEPSTDLYNTTRERLRDQNITFYNGCSEDLLPRLLPDISGDINFWLDGHYSAGITFRGNKDCPVEDELEAIEKNLDNFNKISILIDDVRCFLPSSSAEYNDYPSIDYLVDWARRFNMHWRIEQDIFIIRNHI